MRGWLTEATDYRPTNAGTIWTLFRDVTNETMKTWPTIQLEIQRLARLDYDITDTWSSLAQTVRVKSQTSKR